MAKIKLNFFFILIVCFVFVYLIFSKVVQVHIIYITKQRSIQTSLLKHCIIVLQSCFRLNDPKVPVYVFLVNRSMLLSIYKQAFVFKRHKRRPYLKIVYLKELRRPIYPQWLELILSAKHVCNFTCNYLKCIK